MSIDKYVLLRTRMLDHKLTSEERMLANLENSQLCIAPSEYGRKVCRVSIPNEPQREESYEEVGM